MTTQRGHGGEGRPLGDPVAAGLIERDEQSDVLASALTRASEGEGTLLLVEAPAGLGKSALLAAAAARGRTMGSTVLEARGSQLETALAFGLVRQLFEVTLDGAREADRRALLAGPAARAGRLLLGGEADPELDELELLHAFYWLCSNLAERAPLLLLLDDLHWADPASLGFLGYLAPRLADLPVTVAAAVRSGEPGAAHGPLARLGAERTTIVIRLGALSEAGSAAFVRRRLPAAEARFCRAAHEASAGNPFLLGELTSAVAAEGLRPGTEAARRVARLTPESVLRTTLARLEALPPGALQLARVAAVLGGPAALRHAAELAGLDIEPAARAADALVAVGVVRGADPIPFVHPLVRAALEASLPDGERGLLHRRAAGLLSSEGADAERVAAHLLESPRAGDPWTVERLGAAAEEAMARGAADSARRYLRRALDEPPPAGQRAEVLAALAEAEVGAGDPAALTHLEEALELSSGPGARAESLRRLGWMLYRAGRMPEAAVAFGRGLEARPGVQDELTAELSTAHLAVRTILGDVDPSELERSANAGRAAAPGTRRAEREALTQLALARLVACAPHTEPRELAERALGDGEMLAEDGVTLTFSVAVSCLIWCEALDRAEAEIEGAIELLRRRAAPVTTAYVMFGRSWARYWRGRVNEAAADAGAAIDAWRGGFSLHLPLAAYWRATSLIELEDLEGAAAALDIPDIAEREAAYRVYWHAAHGRLALARGDARSAHERYREVAELAPGIAFLRNPATLPWRGEAAVSAKSAGDDDRARRLVEEDLTLLRRFGAPRALGMGLRTAGLVEGGERGTELLTDSVSVLERSPSRLELCRSLVDLGALLRRRGRRAEARAPLRRALALANGLQATALRRRAGAELEAAGGRPRREAVSGVDALTPSERRVAELAAGGRSNPEIAQELFVSRKTVEWHLGNVYRKLDVSTRADLAQALRLTG